jgi:AcrR family transcriptional regulator
LINVAALKELIPAKPTSTNTREHILETARTLMIEQGMGAVTIRGVARAAGIAPGNLGYYFATYDELLRNLTEWVIEPYLQTFDLIRAHTGDDPIASLRAVLSYILEDLATEETTMFFPELWVLANRSKHSAKCMQELYVKYMAVLEDLIATARPDLSSEQHKELSLFICASIEGQTVFLGYQRPFAEHREAVYSIALETMIGAVVNHVRGT